MSSVRRLRVASVTVEVVVACCLVLAGCSASDDSSTPPVPTPSEAGEASESSTPLGDLDTTSLVVPRAPFCGRVEDAAASRALGHDAAEVSAYRPGQRVRIAHGVSDVVHEFGCRWRAGKNTAQAWVFAPPITRRRAAALVREVGQSPGCAGHGAPRFGRPSRACLSGRPRDGETMTLQGLFGDAWLACSLTLSGVPEQELTERATTWCADVVTGAATGS